MLRCTCGGGSITSFDESKKKGKELELEFEMFSAERRARDPCCFQSVQCHLVGKQYERLCSMGFFK